MVVRIHIICEGQTEEAFVKNILTPYFSLRNIHLFPSLIGKPGHKGGAVKINRLYTDIHTYLSNDTSSYCSTFFDYYGLPKEFPGKSNSASATTATDKSSLLLAGLNTYLAKHLPEESLRRFIPYVQMHEFESLFFSDIANFAKSIGQPSLQEHLQSDRDQFANPEEINDSPKTAPSKRILSYFPKYQKVLDGVLASRKIGLDAIRRECPLFNQWLQKMEDLKQ